MTRPGFARLAVVAFPLVIGVGCFRGRLPAVELYRLSRADTADGTAIAPTVSAPFDGALAVEPYTTPGVYGARGVVYRIGETTYGSYPYREWAIPLGEMLGMRTADLLRTSPLTRDGAVYDPPSRRQYVYLWQGVVREFEEVDRGKAVFAAVSLEARLIRAADDSVMWTGTHRLERAVPSGTMTAIIETLSDLATEAIQALVADVKKAAPAAGAPPTTQRP